MGAQVDTLTWRAPVPFIFQGDRICGALTMRRYNYRAKIRRITSSMGTS